ncbi:hypothetical protein RMSM_06575 [Rhodopirellula maiorica SM1]|uniref:Uncharacterized protein n=1 Tax=Rhodopirellula maiorica SM1 TaxID=1265738 RepID=M5RM83_9BACT|nr:hypothetical protein RMSM_06575 [Rhodopirellula maiorica SM1]
MCENNFDSNPPQCFFLPQAESHALTSQPHSGATSQPHAGAASHPPQTGASQPQAGSAHPQADLS